MRRLQLYLHTIRHLYPAQISGRLMLRVKRAARESAPRSAAALRRTSARRIATRSQPQVDLRSDPLTTAEAAVIRSWAAAWRAGEPRYLNHSEQVGWPPQWGLSRGSQLWRYHLHYFDEAPLLAQGDAESRAVLRGMVVHWTAQVPCGGRGFRDPWHPYVVALRLVNWLLAWLYAPATFDGLPQFHASLQEHVVFLQGNLETDVGGNHLLKNLKALAFASACWPEWHSGRGAASRFTAELERQVLADGVHYERSPMYHLQVLGDALELMLLLRATGTRVPEGLTSVVRPMVNALGTFTHPDGDIALLGDSALDMTTSATEAGAIWADLSREPSDGRTALRHRPLLRGAPVGAQPAAHPSPSRLAPGRLDVHSSSHARTHSGIVRLDSPRFRLIADVGALCPDELPAHAQADTFTFELSVDGTRLVVDSGVDEYAPGPWRAYYRSTRAHNTVEVDGEDSSECWGSFRAARRARVSEASLHVIGAWQVLVGQHDGYTRLPQPVTHRRTFALASSSLLVVHDRVAGAGRHVVKRHLHLHPDTEIRSGMGPRDLVLRRGKAALRLAWSDSDAPTVLTGASDPPQGWYGERFGGRRAAPVLVWTSTAALPLEAALALLAIDGEAPSPLPLQVDPDGTVHHGGSAVTPPPRPQD